jgi:hypothetical protein
MDDLAHHLPSALALLVIFVAMPLDWYVTFILWRLTHTDPKGRTLRAVTAFSFCIALTITVLAVIFINNGMDEPVLSTYETMVITRATLLVLSVVPAVYWLRWYRSNGH